VSGTTTTSALGPGQSQVITIGATWKTLTASYTPSSASDVTATARLEGSADGTTFFPLRPYDGFPPFQTGTGAVFYRDQPVIAVNVIASCSEGNTVIVTVAGE
jgi:hypothetical protein